MGSVLFSQEQSDKVVQLYNMIYKVFCFLKFFFFCTNQKFNVHPFYKTIYCSILTNCMQGIATPKRMVSYFIIEPKE